jgi:hypothetical protein
VEFSPEGRQDKNPTTKMTTQLTPVKPGRYLIVPSHGGVQRYVFGRNAVNQAHLHGHSLILHHER